MRKGGRATEQTQLAGFQKASVPLGTREVQPATLDMIILLLSDHSFLRLSLGKSSLQADPSGRNEHEQS